MLDFLHGRPPSLWLPELQTSMLLNSSNIHRNFFFEAGPGYGSHDISSRSGRIVIMHWERLVCRVGMFLRPLVPASSIVRSVVLHGLACRYVKDEVTFGNCKSEDDPN